jgi:hypothetical protein
MVAILELVCDVELRGDVKHLGGLSAVRGLEQGRLGLRHGFVWPTWIWHDPTPVKACVFVFSLPIGLTDNIQQRGVPRPLQWQTV